MIDENPSVLFSELGTPACARPQKLEQYSQTELWPPNLSNNYWITCGTFWVIYDEMTELFGNFEEFENKIAAYASAFRFIQAESLRSSAASVRIKGKEKAGMIIWMANEPFPNAANTSLLEFDGCPKPAYYEVKKCFSSKYVGLKYASPAVKGKTTAKVFACADSPALIGKIKLTVYNINGEIINQYNWKDISVDGYFEIDNVEIDVNEKIVLARITAENHPELTTEYIFTKS
jgi:beta-mannosidase